MGCVEAGRNLTISSSVITACEVHDVHPQDYIADAIVRAEHHTNFDDLEPQNRARLFGPQARVYTEEQVSTHPFPDGIVEIVVEGL